MSKVYPKHSKIVGGGSGERIRPSYQSAGRQQQQARPQPQQARQQQHARPPPQQQQQSYGQQQQRSRPQGGLDDYWPSTFTILCSIPVIFILYHYICKLLSHIIWGSLTVKTFGKNLKIESNELKY